MSRYKKGDLITEQVKEMTRTQTDEGQVLAVGSLDMQTPTDDMALLREKVLEYVPKNEQSNKLKKIVSNLNNEIKALMEKLKMTSFKADDMVVSISTTESASFDEEVLLAVVKQLGMTDLIKTREYVDMQGLEAVLYDKNVPSEVKAMFATAQIMSTTTKLTAKRAKAGKGLTTEMDI